MLSVDILSLFPEYFDSPLKCSILKRAQDAEREIIKLKNQWDFDENFGFIVSVPFPLTATPLYLITAFTLISLESPKKLNNILAQIIFSLYFSVELVIYSLVSFILLPLAF